ncbi:DNA-binding protein [Jiangella asiatica]|uniref:DNA-binding protein n=1 Tax=Jiangella asiatica TaxID=2530372 RepID=A0A4R5DIQ2_9ACTN|nr:DNA-binding protein [Jiangella asiatica]TDE10655.1 DNA-binding protein [Jiangella asiatica]
MTSTKPLAADELRDLPATIDVVTAGRFLGIGRQSSYALARTDDFPVKVHRLGGRLRVVTADLAAFLGVAL